MDEILRIFGGGSKDDDYPENGSSGGYGGDGHGEGGRGGGRNPHQSLPGGGGVWEFEMPAGGIQEWQEQQRKSGVYNVPAPESDRRRDPQQMGQQPQGYGDDPVMRQPEPMDPMQMSPMDDPSFAVPGGAPISEIEVQESTIEGYMKTMGIQFEKADTCLWMMKYEGGAKDYDIYVELTSSSVRFVMPVLERVRDVCREKVWYHLLRLNYVTDDITMGLNKRDEIFMSSILPMKYISYDDFKRCMTYMFTMADEIYPELLFLAQKTTAVSTFLQSEGAQGTAAR